MRLLMPIGLLLALTLPTLAKAPPKKVSITDCAPVVVNGNAKPVQYLSTVSVFLKDAASALALGDISKWNVMVFKSDGSATALRGDDEKNWIVSNTDNAGRPATDKDGNLFVKKPTSAPVVKGLDFTILTLPDGTLTQDLTAILVGFDNAQHLCSSGKQTITAQFEAASDKAHSDIYLSGLYSPAINSSAQYTIDAKMQLLTQIPKSAIRMGGIATVSTDKRPSADPDSYFVSGLMQWIPVNQRFLRQRAEGVLVDWYFTGLEFDRKTSNRTLLTAPQFEVPLRIYPAPKQKGPLSLAVGMIPYLGFEAGSNLSNSLNKNGSGGVFRGLAGSSFDASISPNLPFLSKISLSATYAVRIPALPEVFTPTTLNNKGQTVDVPVLSTQARHHVTDELDFTFSKPFAFTIKHEYGEVPPVFRVVDHKVSIGLTVMIQQKNSGLSYLERNSKY